MNKRVTYRGNLRFSSGAGSEAGHWSFQGAAFPQGTSTGLHFLQTGDELTVFDPGDSDAILWSGVVRFTQHEAPSHQAGTGQSGADHEEWSAWFREGYPAELTTSA